MHPAAEYVHRDKDGRAWSTFEDFQELIALLYLAAIDEEAPPIDDYTIETRVEQFFIELALIGRAHNWDATDREEEYDDLEADQPSCPRGVRKRLLQSVKGHPLLRILTTDIVHHDVSRIVRTHFISRITDENCAALARDWSTVVNCESLASPSTLKILDFTQEEKDTHTHSLELSYGDLLDNELRKYLHSLFNNSNFKSLAEKFGGITDLGNLIAAQIRESSSKASSVASNGFFNQQLQAYAEAENDTRIKRPRND
ncbi:MAG: hypothetical protein EBY16_09795 [Gammaproteobacteria bacterium]|nr:hypothetical protein [Gammaproteobacteria bacterium]